MKIVVKTHFCCFFWGVYFVSVLVWFDWLLTAGLLDGYSCLNKDIFPLIILLSHELQNFFLRIFYLRNFQNDKGNNWIT